MRDFENTNDKNLEFYGRIDLAAFAGLAKVGGFDTYKDLETISSYLSPYTDVLELGAGYGRCLEYFKKTSHRGKIIAIEKSAHLAEYLREHYGKLATIIEGDIKTLHLDQQVDVALWMWSGIIDFSKAEQAEACETIIKFIKPKGKLFIDVPRIGTKTIAHHEDAQNLVLSTEYGDIHAYIPSDQDVEWYCKRAGFSRFVHIDYQTATEKKRTIYMLEK